jgi:hypothetical protein
MGYFNAFPNIRWNNLLMVDITRRAAVINKLRGNPFLFVPYEMQSDDTPQTIALNYYGDSQLDWLIYLANNTIDPYTDFYKSQTALDQFVIQKYSLQAEISRGRQLKKYEVLDWTQDETTEDNILFWYSSFAPNVKLSVETMKNSTFASYYSEFKPKRIYTYEFEENDAKRTIKLISQSYATQVMQEFREILNG